MKLSKESCCASSTHVSAVEFSSNTRPHISINVPNLSIVRHFYNALFGEEPVKEMNDYIKWELDNPPLNFTLNQHPPELMSKETLGIELGSIKDIESIFQRLGKTDFMPNSSESLTVDDPFGNHWEFKIRDSKISLSEKNDLPDVTLWEFAWDSTNPVPDKNVLIRLNVADLAESILFYRHFLDAEPKWQDEERGVFADKDPAIRLELIKNPNPKPCSGHYGFQMKNTYWVEEVHRRLADQGFKLTSEKSVACCYAVQTKIWVADPDGNRWEFFVTTGSDADEGCGPDCICHKSLERTLLSNRKEDAMSNKLQEMSTVIQKKQGVEVRVQGDVEKGKIEEMVEKCSTGTQSCCDPDFFSKVNSIKVSGQDGDVSIHVSGNEVTKEMIEANLRNCDCYQP